MTSTPRLKEQYNKTVRKELLEELSLGNLFRVPRLEKVVINIGLGEALSDKGVWEIVEKEFKQISGQKPVQTLAKRAIAGFNIRKDDPIGMKVTLRGNRMWEFLDKLISVVFPRTKDFRGLPVSAFDNSGNYTIGITEQTVFSEINPNDVVKFRGMEVTIVTSAENKDHSKALLDKFGFPFAEDGKKV